MKCANIKKLLPDYSVGALSKKKRELVKRHINTCPECMRELEFLDKTASLLDSIPQEEPPDFLWERVKSEIIQQGHSTETLGIKFQSIWQGIMGWLWGKRIPALATGLAVLILVAGYILPHGNLRQNRNLNSMPRWNNRHFLIGIVPLLTGRHWVCLLLKPVWKVRRDETFR